MTAVPVAHRTTSSPLERLRRGEPVHLLQVWAHPDDEAYLAAGLAQRVVRAGGRVTCLTMTRGERGVADGDRRTEGVVQRLRAAELRASLAEVGVQSLRLLRYADGGCDQVPVHQGVADVARAMDAMRPDLVVTFGADGITGHPDHVAVHHWVTEAWGVASDGVDLLYASMTEEFLHRYQGLHDRLGVFGDHRPVGAAAEELALSIDLDDRELDRKRRALAAHASQTTALAEAMGEATYRAWWATESFRLAPPRTA